MNKPSSHASMSRRIGRLISLFNRREKVALAWLMLLMASVAVLEMVCVGLIPLFVLALQNPTTIREHALLSDLAPGVRHLTDAGTIYAMSLAVLGIFIFKNVFSWFTSAKQYGFMHSKMHELSTRLLVAYLQKPYTFHLQRNSAELYRNVMNECSTVVSMVVLPASSLIIDSLIVACIGALLVYHHPVLTLAAAALFGSTSFVLYQLVKRRALALGTRHQQHGRLASLWLNQSLGGIKEAIVAGRESSFLDRFSRHWRESTDAQSGILLLGQLPRFFNETIAVLAVLFLANAMLLQGKASDEIVLTLALFGAATFRLVPTLSRIVGSFTAVRFAFPSINTLSEDLAENPPPLAARVVEHRDRRPAFDSIRLENITYRYPGAASDALSRISLEIGRCMTVGIIGASGAGKTTLADVVLGLLKPTAGRVLVGDRDIQQELGRWQARIGYVPQTIFLLDDTIRRNIAFGVPDPEIGEHQVRRAARLARLEELIASLPSGLDTAVGERGVRLSGGQRQRIGIARALYHQPDLLMLDEATSALDNQTETEITDAIAALSEEVTTVIIAHRVTTLRHCDRIIFLSAGKLVAYGAYEELLRDAPELGQLVAAGLP